LVRLRLRWWLIRVDLFPFLPIPNFSSITTHAAVLIGFYNTSEVLAEAISLIYGDEELHQKMVALLGTVNSELQG